MTPTATEAEQLVESLRIHFGPNWTWSEIAEWIEARAQAHVQSSAADLPRFQIAWARDFMETRRRQLAIERSEGAAVSSGAAPAVPKVRPIRRAAS